MTVNEFIQNSLNNPSRISHQVTNPNVSIRIHSSPLSLHRKSVYHPGTGGNRLLGKAMNAGDSAMFVCLQMIKHMWMHMYGSVYVYI